MVASMRKIGCLRAVGRQFRVDPGTVRHWFEHARGQRLDRVDFSGRPTGRRCAINRTSPEVEQMILQERERLKDKSDLGYYGAQAIADALSDQGQASTPGVRTINRVLERHGALRGHGRQRRPPPPPGWYLPDVGARLRELDSFDIVEGLAIKGGAHFELFNGISLHGKLADSHLTEGGHSAKTVLAALIAHWRRHGLPAYAQFDNDSRFQGPHSRVDIISRVPRLCLALGVTPVFAIPRETGFQAAIEGFNGLWQEKVWKRFTFGAFDEVCVQSQRFIAARRRHLAVRIEQAPPRAALAEDWRLDLQRQPSGRMIFIRRTGEKGGVELLGHKFEVDRHWQHRMVRCEVELDSDSIHFFGLSRRRHNFQPKLGEQNYQIPNKRFHE